VIAYVYKDSLWENTIENSDVFSHNGSSKNVFDPCSETNLKVRQALVETADMGEDTEQLSAFDGIITAF